MALEQEQNLGRQKIREFMRPGEVFLGNTLMEQEARGLTYSDPKWGIFAEDVPTLEDEIAALGKKYDGVRIIDTAFKTDGTPASNHVAIVGTPKAETDN